MDILVRSVCCPLPGDHDLTFRKRQSDSNVTDAPLPVVSVRSLQRDTATDGSASGSPTEKP
jgi:hypothetical protein